MMPLSLEILILGDHWNNTNKFTGGLPAEWGSLTNLKELKMVACGLDGGCLVSPGIPRRSELKSLLAQVSSRLLSSA